MTYDQNHNTEDKESEGVAALHNDCETCTHHRHLLKQKTRNRRMSDAGEYSSQQLHRTLHHHLQTTPRPIKINMKEIKHSVPSKPTKESLFKQYKTLAQQQQGISKQTSLWRKVREEKREIARQLALIGFDVRNMKSMEPWVFKPHVPESPAGTPAPKHITSLLQTTREEAKKEERERILAALEKHKRTNTYDGEESKVFLTTLAEVAQIITNQQ